MSQRLRIAVLMGGRSHEHEVSINSGNGILSNLMPDRYEGLGVVIGKDGLWRIGSDAPRPMLEALQVLCPQIDAVFLALHGPNGEDGTVQGLFHLLGTPFTGSDHFASSLAMNKPRTKDVYRAAGIATPDSVAVRQDQVERGLGSLPDEIAARLGLPVVAKTTKLGSSVGVEIVRDVPRLAQILIDFMRYGSEVLVEQFIQGREVTSPVIDHPDQDRPVALPLIEIRPRVSAWFDYEAKYKVGGSEEICPAPISPELTHTCQEIGLAAHRILGCSGMSRTDILIRDDGACFAIETNTIPGFTRTSLLPQSAAAAGISYPQLVDLLIREAVVRVKKRLRWEAGA
ncbi:MAG: D-alanine--D-alanine ligase [Deltaproteobacteria bacterium]|nr:D-alanine--D-alanine ligase [Deltaproteobacteria bacterium]